MVYDSIILKIANGIGNTMGSKKDLGLLDYAEVGGCTAEEISVLKDAMSRESHSDTAQGSPVSEEILCKIEAGIAHMNGSRNGPTILDYAKIGGCSDEELNLISDTIDQTSHTEQAPKNEGKISRSTGVIVPSGHIVGGGYRGLTEELDKIVSQEAELLRAHFGMDVTIRFNSDRLSGGAWIVDSSIDDLPSWEHEKLRRAPDTMYFTTAINLEKTNHTVPEDSKRILLGTEYGNFDTLEAAASYLFSHVMGLKEQKHTLDTQIQAATNQISKTVTHADTIPKAVEAER